MRRELKKKLASDSTISSTAEGVFSPPVPQSVKYPFVTIQSPMDDHFHTLEGVQAVRREMWQIDIYAEGAGAWTIVDVLSAKVRALVDGKGPATWYGTKVLSSRIDDERDLPFDSEKPVGGIARRSIDVVIKYETS